MPQIMEEAVSSVPSTSLPDVMEALLQADAAFVRRLLDAAPLPAGSTKQDKYLELTDRYERYMPSSEVKAIARFLYMLGAYGVTGGDGLRRLIAAHNEHMAALAADADYLRRERIPRKRLLEAVFSGPAADNAVSNFNDHGGVALDATGMGRLLVEFANKHQVAEAMGLLAALGFFRTVLGAYNASVFVSDGRLEAVYAAYLAHVAEGMDAALGGPDATEKEHDDVQPA